MLDAGGRAGTFSVIRARAILRAAPLLSSRQDGNPPTAAGTMTPGSTWHFQAWFRDPAGGGAFFDLSDGLTITFQ